MIPRVPGKGRGGKVMACMEQLLYIEPGGYVIEE